MSTADPPPAIEKQQLLDNAAAKEDAGVSPKTMDDFTRLGPYCWRILLFSEFVLLSAMGNMMFMVYAGAAPKSVHCAGSTDNLCKTEGGWRTANCTLEYTYDFHSINIDMGYLCSDSSWVKSSISLQMVGVLFGSLLFGWMSDKYGRLTTLHISYYLTALSSLSVFFSPNHLNTFTALRVLLGFFNGGQIVVFSVYKIENVPKRHRIWISALIAWAPNYILLNGIAYLSGDWRTLQLVIFLASTPAVVLFWCVYESPRWLIQRGRIEEARAVMEKIQNIDGVKQSKRDDLEKMLTLEHERHLSRESKVKNYNVRHLFYTTKLSIITITFSAGMFFTAMISYGLLFNIEKLSGSIFLNSSIYGCLRWAINITSSVLDYHVPWCGRKLFHAGAQTIISLCVGSIALLYLTGHDEEYFNVIRVASIVATACCSQVYMSKGITAVEYYPTVVRNSAISFKSICGRIGTIIAPQLFILFSGNKAVPYLVMTSLSVIDATLFQVLLPETKNRPLPENLPEKRKKGKEQTEQLVKA